MNFKSLWTSFEEFVSKVQFTGGKRIDLYRDLAMLLDNNVQISEALYELYQVYSDEGKKPGEPLAIVTKECHQAYANGRKLYQALQRWAPQQEVALLEAGETTGALSRALKDAVAAIRFKSRIKAAVATATIYPTFMNMMAGVLLWIISNMLVPKMAMFSDPSTWEGTASLLSLISDATTTFGLYGVIATLLLLTAVLWSLPRWTGDLRVYADTLPIYTTYRTLHGATFLLNVSVLIRAGIPLHDGLVQLAQGTSPWLRERISFAAYGTKQGTNLGIALQRAGQNFPDRRAVQFLKILATRNGFEDALHNFSKEWLDRSISKIEAAAKVWFVLSLMAMASLMAIVIIGTFDMQMAVEQSATSRI